MESSIIHLEPFLGSWHMVELIGEGNKIKGMHILIENITLKHIPLSRWNGKV